MPKYMLNPVSATVSPPRCDKLKTAIRLGILFIHQPNTPGPVNLEYLSDFATDGFLFLRLRVHLLQFHLRHQSLEQRKGGRLSLPGEHDVHLLATDKSAQHKITKGRFATLRRNVNRDRHGSVAKVQRSFAQICAPLLGIFADRLQHVRAFYGNRCLVGAF